MRAPRGERPVDTPRRFRQGPSKTIGQQCLLEHSYLLYLYMARCVKRSRINDSEARVVSVVETRVSACTFCAALKSVRERTRADTILYEGRLPKNGTFFLFLSLSGQLTTTAIVDKLHIVLVLFFSINLHFINFIYFLDFLSLRTGIKIFDLFL